MTTTNENQLHYNDGFDGPQSNSRAIQGQLLKFTSDEGWTLGEESAPKTPLLAVDVKKVLQRWEDQRPVETEIFHPSEPDPDLDAKNSSIPTEEWERGMDNQLRPPWQLQLAVYLLNPDDGSTYTAINGTVGHRIAVEQLLDRVRYMRAFRGGKVVPIVRLSSVLMKTKFGTKRRPHFKIVDWRGGQGQSPNLIGGPVSPVPTSEIVEDAIPF